jgi:hypothetical protein
LLGTSGFKAFVPLTGITKVVIFGDNDLGFAGQAAAYAAAVRLSSLAGRQIEVEVRIPEIAGEDWNDVHRRQMVVARLQTLTIC